MNTYLITVKLPQDPGHDPRNKKTGVCPLAALVGYDGTCTDVTGAHHTVIVITAQDLEGVKGAWEERFHVTRIEVVPAAIRL